MKKSTLITLLMIVIFSFIGCMDNNKKVSNEEVSNSQELTEKEKLEDFEYMYTILKDNYPYFEVNKRQNGVDWLSKKNEYIDRIKASIDDESYRYALKSIMAELNNGHAYLLEKNFYFYAKDAFNKNSNYCEAWLNQLNKPKAIERYEATEGQKDKSPDSSNSPSKHAISDNAKVSILEKNKTAYLAIGSFRLFNIEDDMKIIKPFLQDIKGYKALIIDLRGNEGGATMYWSDNIVPMLIDRPLDYSNYIAYRGGAS